MKEPIAETVAGPEPEIAAKNMQASTVTIARPPVMKPTRLSARLTRRREMPPLHISAPARMKKGIASSGKESSPVTDFCASISIGISEVSHIASPVASPRVIPIGMLSAIVTMRMEKTITASISIPPQYCRFAGRAARLSIVCTFL
ncbi:hypothetical protein SDC9_172592 [bioreactor metagenome]|uniref:Uncharacterized protein n=1 Tax=bioreactor metagenome TaxID=1076179 RepID=A0A645GES4_9ZZZZ